MGKRKRNDSTVRPKENGKPVVEEVSIPLVRSSDEPVVKKVSFLIVFLLYGT